MEEMEEIAPRARLLMRSPSYGRPPKKGEVLREDDQWSSDRCLFLY